MDSIKNNELYIIGADGLKPVVTDGKNDLKPGTILYFHGYSNDKLVIVRNQGINDSFQNHGAGYLCVNLRTFEQHKHNAFSLEFFKNKKDDRIKVYITDEVLNESEVKKVWDQSERLRQAKQNLKPNEEIELNNGEIVIKCIDPEILARKEKQNMGTKEIAKEIRQKLKKDYPNSNFSVTIDRYSGGSSINIDLMESDIKIIKDFNEISESAIYFYTQQQNYKEENIKKAQEENYHQLNEYTLKEDYNPDHWNNGTFLTEPGHKLLSEVVKIAGYYNWDKSEPQTDYFDVNFYLHINIGKWDKPFVQA